MAVTDTPFIQERPYQAVSITHFCIDVLNSSRNLLIALLAISLGLTNAQVGITLLLYNVGASLSQPFFGWLADRIGPRWLVVGGMGWMTFFFTFAALAGDWIALAALTVAGIGSGMFHPAGTMVASLISHTARSRATAVFFFSGQMGLFLGPIVAGLALDWHGRTGYVLIPLTTLFAFAYGWLWLTNDHAGLHAEKAQRAQARAARAIQRRDWLRRGLPLTIIILSSSTVSIAAITFAPKLFTEAGYAQTHVGILAGMLMLGSALGGIVGGALGDRIAGKWVIVAGMWGLILPIYFYIPADGLAQPALLLLAGFFAGMPHTILVLNVQSLFPGRRALASGLALGLMFAGGALGSYFLGLLADQIGLATALQYTAVLPIIAALTALVLPARP
ncbi:MAG: MFS transporter [Anaerolineae bacterium]|nr:MFS transporter [Anaerolineae bacterium]